MSVLIIIPARYASSRFPGKPLAMLKGATGESKSLIQRSWEAAQKVSDVDRIVVATDDARIEQACLGFGAEVVITSSDCVNGTERCAEAFSNLGDGFDVIVNLQGDAPLTPPWFIEQLIDGLKYDETADLATPVLRCDADTLAAFREDRANGRVGGTTAVFGATHHALYFSKEVIPFADKLYHGDEETPVFHHVGVYCYRPAALLEYPAWPVGPLETLEGLEQLRFLENRRGVLCVEVEAMGRKFWELNNPEDTARIEEMMLKMHMP